MGEPARKAQQIRLIIKSDLESVYLIGLSVRAICSYLPFDDVAAYQVEVSVVEAVNNAIKHAYRNEAWHEVEVSLTILEDRLNIQICDAGNAMDKEKVLKSGIEFDPADTDKLPEGGMGLHIICSAMDSVNYQVIEQKNVLSMSKLFQTKQYQSPSKT